MPRIEEVVVGSDRTVFQTSLFLLATKSASLNTKLPFIHLVLAIDDALVDP